jgi:hypothetical protein
MRESLYGALAMTSPLLKSWREVGTTPCQFLVCWKCKMIIICVLNILETSLLPHAPLLPIATATYIAIRRTVHIKFHS